MFTITKTQDNKYLLSYIAQNRGVKPYPLYVKRLDTEQQCKEHINKYSKLLGEL